MSRRPLLGASCVAALCLAAALALLGGGRVGTTFAFFNAETKNTGSSYAVGWITAPTAASAALSGAGVNLSWTVSTHRAPTPGQAVLWLDNGTSTTCPTTGYATAGTPAAAATTYSDASRGSTYNGHEICYRVAETAGTQWSTQAQVSAIKVGFYATGVVIANNNGTLANNDTIAITFNQPPAAPGSTTKVCSFASSKTILVGDSSGCASATGDTYAFKLVTTGTMTNNNSDTGSYAVSGNKLTVTVGGNPATNKTTVASGTWSYSPSTIASATGSVVACNSAALACLPTPSGNF